MGRCAFRAMRIVSSTPLKSRREAIASPGGVHQFAALVVTEDQCVECAPADRVSAYYELLTLVDAHFLPGPQRWPGS